MSASRAAANEHGSIVGGASDFRGLGYARSGFEGSRVALIDQPVVVVDAGTAYAFTQALARLAPPGRLEAVLRNELGFGPRRARAVLAMLEELAQAGELAKARALDVRDPGHMSDDPSGSSATSEMSMVTTAQAARLLRLTPRHTLRRAAAGEFGAVRTPRGWMLDRAAVLAAARKAAA